MKEWIVGYGSLMSRFGINSKKSTNNISVYNPFAARFKGKRGFNAKPGYYMDIGFGFDPKGHRIDHSIEPIKHITDTFETLVFQVNEEDLPKIAKREGYPNGILNAIKESDNLCNQRQSSIAEYLWKLYCQGNSSLLDKLMEEYRFALDEKLSNEFEIQHLEKYIPHPVKINIPNGSIYALISIHTDIGYKEGRDIKIMTIREARDRRATFRPTYFLECILGGVHGINVRDLLKGIEGMTPNSEETPEKIHQRINEEWNQAGFWNVMGSDMQQNLIRSGLFNEFFNDNFC